ncbi:hypothetical protein [Streptomyces sp. S.PNR 29]|uniref:hypothetical protein n=1 Tax=Streptomyces sp. S.PNR 29 TaxID=2973805 RepID=UPI0025B13B94|nr:hypothetical protein [Streptomyces sp. S.PNR 29]MDN0194650.1 hypothetical protein [Streptomyces sp. S.PNR 29]
MTFGDQGTPYGPSDPHAGWAPDPHAQWAAEQQARWAAEQHARWVAEQEHIRRRRRVRLAVGGGVGLVLVAATAAGILMAVGGSGGGSGTAAAPATAATSGSPAPSVSVGMPSNAPTALPSLLARPVIRPEQAFPEKSVRAADGSRYERVDLATTTDCARGMSPELAELIEQGEKCARLTSALFTDAGRRSQVTVTVLSFRRAEDAGRVFAMASMDPVTYQVVSLDPPPEAGMPTVPPGSPGIFQRLMTVRSVVFANGQWGDGAETEEAALTKQTKNLLAYVNDKVVAYEQGDDED